MVDGSENVLRILIDDPRIDAPKRNKSFYDKVFQEFDLIIKDKSLYPVIKILNLF